jgi:hypothetical protein
MMPIAVRYSRIKDNVANDVRPPGLPRLFSRFYSLFRGVRDVGIRQGRRHGCHALPLGIAMRPVDLRASIFVM